MDTRDQQRLAALLERIGRIQAADEWSDALNPAQRAALAYLARANRFSRAPSQVADYLAATRGTVSQTLKALARKGLVSETRSAQDRRSIAYSLTEAGRAACARQSALDEAIGGLEPAEAAVLANGLEGLVKDALLRRGMRAFGVCRTCRYHEARPLGGYCRLLHEELAPVECQQICHEHDASAA
ncbi:MAG: MarR family winged helix-turn-helix transcriptional regulator [Geminicoccaceae bacterium]